MGVLLLSLAIIPLYQMFVTSSRTMFYSKLSYMAMHVAREELEELRQLPFEKVAGGDLTHDWAPVSGRMLARSLKYRVPEGVTSKLDTEAHSYPKEYERIQTKLEVSEVDPPDARLRKVVLQVRWQEMGEVPKEGDAGQRAALSRFETIVAAHNVPVPVAP
ncbi:MAG: hypothetical protein HYY25_10735 [Candidatus Wallbacteria bacterium]|nr:hypothetical protein [Candidatus Wallbacteria bacterium]